MSEMDSILRDFEVFWMEHDIESTSQVIGPTECANQTVIAMAKLLFETQKLEKLLWMKVVANVVYTLN